MKYKIIQTYATDLHWTVEAKNESDAMDIVNSKDWDDADSESYKGFIDYTIEEIK